jgi:hypothetical protein
MRWTLGLLLLGAVGCAGQTKMVACPDNGCPESYAASSSPQGLPAPRAKQPGPVISTLPPEPPLAPEPDTAPPPPEPPVPSP